MAKAAPKKRPAKKAAPKKTTPLPESEVYSTGSEEEKVEAETREAPEETVVEQEDHAQQTENASSDEEDEDSGESGSEAEEQAAASEPGEPQGASTPMIPAKPRRTMAKKTGLEFPVLRILVSFHF